MKASRLIYVVIVIAIGIWWLSSRGGSEEQKIRSRLEEIRQLVSKDASEKALRSAERARQMADYLAPDFVLRLDPLGQEVTNAAALARPFVGLRQSVQALDVDFSNIEIELNAEESRASSSMVVSLRATGSDLRNGSYRVEIRWNRDGGWRIEELHATDLPRDSLF